MDGKKIKEFPDVENKLQGMPKRSLFEKQKAEQESKRAREAAETAAVYEDFVKSFDEDGDAPGGSDDFKSDRSSGFGGGFGGFNGPPKRHFGAAPTGPSAGRGGFGGRTSGPGSLGPPPPSFNRKRPYEGFQPPSRREHSDRGLLAFEDYDNDSVPPPPPRKAFHTSDDEDETTQESKAAEQAVSKPTIRLANLPPGTSPAVIKALLPSNLTVDTVRILPPPVSGANTQRKSMTAIVTLSKETAGNDIDTAVNSLQNRYLGYGFYLSLHRHLSSAALSSASATAGLGSSAASQPFGAKPINIETGSASAPGPGGYGRGFAPPTSYAPPGPAHLARSGPILHVPVQAPRDIKELKLIHKTIENLLTHGPEFEALLMSRPEVQKEEKWAWLWDSRSTGGVWYRWRLWEILTGSQSRRRKEKFLPLFEDSSAWKFPEQPLVFEYTTQLEEFVSDSDYNSSDEDDSGDEGAGRRRHAGPPEGVNPNDDGVTYLNPLAKAKLTHLLARLPTTTGKLRKGDVARVTAFAISHAGRGADEVVAAIVSNIEKPFAYTSANPERRKEKDINDDDTPAALGGNEDDEKSDTSSASLIGLYLISDILSSSSTSGVRHAWKYRQLFESALKQRQVFERLGRFEKKMKWGRLRAEKWKRSVGNVLSLWEGWCVFPQESQDHFTKIFNDPPLTKEEEEEKKEKEMEGKAKSKWKSVERTADNSVDNAPEEQNSFQPTPQGDIDGEPMEEDVDGEPMDDEDVDGVPMDSDEDLDGEPMEEDGDPDGAPMEEDDAYEPPPPDTATREEDPGRATGDTPLRPPRRRPKAEDMFADSGSEGE